MPGAETLASGAYPYRKDFLIVTRPDISEAAARFLDFVRSEDGRAILVASGNLPAG